MKILSASIVVAAYSLIAFSPSSIQQSPKTYNSIPNTGTSSQKIQAAILLDVSNSMDGLIDQAKAQLWNMVSVMGKVKCENGLPKIEIALYEYGRSSNDPQKGYVKQITGFSSDLDNLSQELFKLTTNGGDEFCGHVIHTSLNELDWDTASPNYKVIFIAGNEDFLQGKISFMQSCAEAKRKGVIVNTIYCGDKLMGIKEHWNLGGECGNGSYSNINQNAKDIDIPTPYDSTLTVLNNKLNGTYLYYGIQGAANYEKQYRMDTVYFNFSISSTYKRNAVKANKQLYNNASWDLIDAYDADNKSLLKVDKKTLPDSLKNKTTDELEQIVKVKSEERGTIQKQIMDLSAQREHFIAHEKIKAANTNQVATLETEVERIIRQQVTRFNMYIE